MLLKQSHGPTLTRPHQHGPVPSHIPCILWMKRLEEPGLLSWLGAGVEHLLKPLNITVDKMT